VSPEDRKQLEAITSALARMVRRQAEVEQRLARLESALNVAPHATQSESGPAVAPPPPASDMTPPRAEPRSRQIETAFGLTWISRIGVITVVLALAFFFEYAFENHWITEWGRVALGLGCGAASLFFGERLWGGGQRTFAQALTAAGIAFLYLSFWAAFALYHLIGQPVDFGLMLLTTGAAGALALRYDGPAIAVLALAGGYVTPLLLASERDRWFVLSYALLLNAGAAVAARSRGWRWLEAEALAGAAILYATEMQFPPSAANRWLFTLFIGLYYGQFASAPLLAAVIAAQVLGSMALAQVWAPAAGAVSLLVLTVLAGLGMADRRGWAAAVPASFAGFWLGYAVWRGIASPPVAVVAPIIWLTAGFAAFLGWAMWRAGYRQQMLRTADLVIVALNPAFYFGAGYALLEATYGAYEGLFAVAVALAAAAAARLLWNHDSRGALLAGGIAWALLVLAAPIQFAGYRVTLAWALEGAAIAWIGIRLRESRALYGAAAVFIMVLLRLALVDAGTYSSPSAYHELANARFLVFLVSALSLWAAAWWARQETRFAVPDYLGGHGVLLWGLGLEAVGWAERTAAPDNLRSVVSTSISVLVAAYAVVLVAVGVYLRHAPTRVLGAALIGFVVAKLYLYDVWLLSQFYRMAAFAILGVLLLLMSYFYSRFRRSVESLWRP